MSGTRPNKIVIGLSIAVALAAGAILCTAAANARGDSGWTGWQNLGKAIQNPVRGEEMFRLATAPFRGGKPVVVTISPVRILGVIEERQGFWANWYFLNYPLAIRPFIAMTQNAADRPILFFINRDQAIWYSEISEPRTGVNNPSVWTDQKRAGRPSDAFPDMIYVTRGASRRVLVCFVDTPTATVRCRVREADGEWGEWLSSFRAPGAIAASLTGHLDRDRRMHFFAASADTLYELPPGGRSMLTGPWRTIGRIPGLRLAAPMATMNEDGRLEVFARGSDNALWHVYQQPGGSAWSAWESLGRPPRAALPFGFATDAATENDDHRLEVFVVAGDGAVWHLYQTRPNCCWSEWESLGLPSSGSRLLAELHVARRSGQSLELFALDSQGTLWTNYQQ